MCGVNDTALAQQIAGLDVDPDAVAEHHDVEDHLVAEAPVDVAAGVDVELQPEALLERNGHKVSKSPWGPDDEIGRLNWVTPDSVGAIMSRLNGTKVFDLSVDYWSGMPSWTEAGDPPFSIWMTHTPRGSILDGRSGYGPEIHKEYAYSGDSISMYTHCGTHIDTLNHMGYYETFWNGWTQDEHLGSMVWTKGGTDRYPPIIARGVLLDVAAMFGVDILEPHYEIDSKDIMETARRQGTELRKGDVVLLRTGRMNMWPSIDYLSASPGINVDGARWLCEEAGAMCIAGDNIGLEPQPYYGQYAPVHCYMFATAGAQIIEVCNMQEIAAEKVYEFAFLGFPMHIRGATGAPMPSVAVPLR
ncbi:MAG: cyclase family protein [Acidimicrobiia bacterium]|nr:cyclase family protein [Acidimicrobiia bacterium]MYJ13737.1 cyclase family protein [Acidimicrobiia bacterium]